MSNLDTLVEGVRSLRPRCDRSRELKILILNGDFPVFPGGIGIEFLNTRGLAKCADRVGLISMIHTQDVLDRAKDLACDAPINLYLWQNPGIQRPGGERPARGWVDSFHYRLATLLTGIRSSLFSRPRETFTSDLNFRNMAAAATSALADDSWDALVVVQTNAASVIDYVPKHRVSALIVHDIRSLLYARRAEVASSRIAKWKLRRESRRYFQFEKKYAQCYDVLIALSEDDAKWIRKHYQPRAVAVVPIPVDTEYFAPAQASSIVPGRIVFTGLMNHPPNIDAAVYFAREVFPLVRESVPHAEFFVVGKCPSPEVLALSELSGVTVTGFVPDTRPYIASAEVIVVPLRYGSGVRNKILEAWGMRKCIVSTTVGAEGLEYQDGRHLTIADGTSELETRVTRCLIDPRYRESLQEHGRNVAVSRHSPKQIARHYYSVLRNLVEQELDSADLRVAIDLRWMIPGQAGGLENVARSFMRTLQDMDHRNRYTVIVPSCAQFDFDLRRSPNIRTVCRDSVRTIAEDLASKVKRRLHGALGLDYWRSAEVRQLQFLKYLDAEIVYSFPGYIHPELRGLRHVLMVPDIQHEYFPEFFAPEAVAERRRLYGESIERADHICAISEFTRQTLIERLGVRPEKVSTVHLAADPMFSLVRNDRTDRAVLAAYGLESGGYLFFPGHTWKHKNHHAALSGLRILRDKHGIRTRLVCTGGSREAQGALRDQVLEDNLADQVQFVGYRSWEDLPALYRNAAGLIFPSLFEGFGMPVLEAMACGCPVICSNTTSLPEIAGDAALLVNPTDHEALAEGVYRLMSDLDLRKYLIERGSERATHFSWRRHTLETVAVFRRVHTSMRIH